MTLPYIKVYKDFISIVRELDNGARGRLFLAIMQYANEEEVDNLTGAEKIAFLTVKSQIDRDRDAYTDISEKRKLAGKAGAERRWEQEDIANAILPIANDSKNSKCHQDKDKDKDKEKEKYVSSLRSETYSGYTPLDDAIKAFIEFRKKMRKPMTDHAIDLLIKKLDTLAKSDDEKVEIVNQSIVNGWQGVFPLKGKDTMPF